MLEFDELKEALDDGDDEPSHARKADLTSVASFADMPEGVTVSVFDDYFPDSAIWRDGDQLVAEITEHIYTKYWEHKWHGRVYAGAMLRAIKRFIAEGHPFTEGSIENDDDPHIFIRWHVGKAAECVIAFLQEDRKGATWMFEDAFDRNKHWQKFVYVSGEIENAVDQSAAWAEDFVKQFGAFQQRVLPWMKPIKSSPNAI